MKALSVDKLQYMVYNSLNTFIRTLFREGKLYFVYIRLASMIIMASTMN